MNRKISIFAAFMLTLTIIVAMFTTFDGSTIALASADDDKIDVKTVYLTFDDGPSDRVTPKILDVLKEENVKATFFIIGKQAENRRYLIEREKAEGHTVAVHSYTHKYKEIYSSTKSLLKDIDDCNAVTKSITGEYSKVYRFPGGSFGLSQSLISAVSKHGLRYVDWNASIRDAEILNATPKQLYSAAICTSADINNIVLLAHDSTTKTATADALRDIIRYYKNKGYSFSSF